MFLIRLVVIVYLSLFAGPYGVGDPTASITEEELRTHLFTLASDEMAGRRPGSEGFRAAAQYAEQVFKEIGLEPMLRDPDGNPTYRQPFSFEYREETVETHNLVGLILGTDEALREEYVTFCAHIDHLGVIGGEVYNGADDNAASCAALLEAAQAIAQNPPRRSVIVILFSAEEMELAGSRHFVDNPPVPLSQMIVNINMEMIGRKDPTLPEGFAFIGAEALSPDLPGIISSVNEKHLGYPLLFIPREQDPASYFRRSDHYNFHLHGIPAVVFGGSMHGDYHTPRDDPEKISIEKVRKAALLSYYLVIGFGDRGERPAIPQERVGSVRF